MSDRRYEDLRVASMTVATEAALIGRLDSGVAGVTSTSKVKKRVTGVMGRCANTGYFVFRLAGQTVAIIDMVCLNAMVNLLPLEIDVPEGLTLAVGANSSSGTAAGTVTLQYEVQ